MTASLKMKENDFVLRISLDGDQTFNPVYEPQILKESRFIEVAQMIKAAGINYMGGGSKEKFWDEAAFNLMKNSLVLVAVQAEYFTLNDIYSQLADSDEEEKVETLKKAEKSDKFDSEEKCNIRFAKQYFEGEFSRLDNKVKTSILVSATTFLNQFQEARASRIFCPEKIDLTISSIDKVIDDGISLIVDIETPGLAKAMGTFIKLQYQKSVLERVGNKTRDTNRSAVLVLDEYQDIVTVSGGSIIGDEKALAKGREANIVTIAATQSYSSLANAIGNDKATRELIQNFRTKIAYHSSDLMTINYFRDLVGQKDVEKKSHSFSEVTQDPRTNLVLGGMEGSRGSISESLNQTTVKEFAVSGKDFTGLKTFEAIALVYDGTATSLKRLFMKPHFLKKKNTSHRSVLNALAGVMIALSLCSFWSEKARAFPQICDVIRAPQFNSCMDLKIGSCVCGFPFPRPCAKLEYYLPQSFVEVQTGRGETFFKGLPGVAAQLATLPSRRFQDGYVTQLDRSFFHAHSLAIPFSSFLSGLPCGGERLDTMCFDAMSEHLGSHWVSGKDDKLHPQFYAWSVAPKACLAKAAITSVDGNYSHIPRPGAPICSFPIPFDFPYPPSTHPQCTGWGFFFPRTGHVDGPATNTGALLVAARLRSLASEVFNSTPTDTNEKWQLIQPQETSCFKEGQNMAILEPIKGVTERGRMMGGAFKGFLVAIWKKVTCCQDLSSAIQARLHLEFLRQMCQVAGG